MRKPTIPTLALTPTVPLTVEPDTGDVIVTIRLPVGGNGGSSCARAPCGAIQVPPSVADRIIAYASLLILFITLPLFFPIRCTAKLRKYWTRVSRV